jgi:cephalosporin-C deacetylase-like acetyl esterase
MTDERVTGPKSEWETERKRLIALLGGLRKTAFSVVSRQPTVAGLSGARVEVLQLLTANGTTVRAFLTGPQSTWHRQPAILYCHAHGNRYDIGARELVEGRPALLTPSYGEALAQEGIVSLCIDLRCFGLRTSETEQAAAKRHLLHGTTLFGAMLEDLAGAADVLAALDGVDGQRIGAFGLSMGATHAFWLGALDTRIKAVAHLCCFADLETLVSSGAHDLHGNYMTVPGLLARFRTGEIAGLIAPRPQLACMGLLDPLTPPDAVEQAVGDAFSGYVLAGAPDALQIVISSTTGHAETPGMRAAVLDFFAATL